MNGNNIRCLFFGSGLPGATLSNYLYDQLRYRDYCYLGVGTTGRKQIGDMESILKGSWLNDRSA